MSEADRISARPGAADMAFGPTPAGLAALPLGGQRDSYLYVAPGIDAARPSPLVLLLHGAGGHAHDGLRVLLHLADHAGLILVAPASTGATWDIIARRRYGPDLALADAALAWAFARYTIDPGRIGVGGFSDGASYALSLGLNNGDLFSHVLAFSPGFIGPGTRRGQPQVFISHGTRDRILPIDPCSRHIVAQLRERGLDPHYREFEGEHVIPPEVAREAVDWFVGGGV